MKKHLRLINFYIVHHSAKKSYKVSKEKIDLLLRTVVH